MKKIFLTSAVILCMACPAFADDPVTPTGITVVNGVAQNNDCDYNTLGAYSGSVNLEAQWSAKRYSVTYNKGAHAATGVNDYVDEYNETTNPTGGARYDSNYVALTGGGANAAASQTGIYAAPGYSFAGWTMDSTPTFTNNTLNNPWTGATPWQTDGDVTVYAAYTANPITITFNCNYPNGASTTQDGTGPVPPTGNIPMDGSGALSASCTLPGYGFNGWKCTEGLSDSTDTAYVMTNGRTPLIANGATVYVHNSNGITCYADWTPNRINLDWKNGYNGGTVTGGGTYCDYDGDVTLPPTPTRTGYKFAGWRVDTTQQGQSGSSQQTTP